jgi:lactate dehydrogenase-like 2-hydroxyacid dehydrogenase
MPARCNPLTKGDNVKKIHIARLLTDRVMTEVRGSNEFSVTVGEEQPPSREQLLARVAGADATVVTLTEQIDEEFLDAAGPQLKVVANVAVGFDNVDVGLLARRGIVVTNTPGVLDGATADHTFALILALSRRLVEGDRFLREGNAWVWGPRMLVGLDVSAGATLGIVGLGRIGRAVARRAKAFDMTVIAADATQSAGEVVDSVPILPLEELLATSDVVSLHVPLLDGTRHMIGARQLATMKSTAYLVNAARGGIVDEAALIAAIDAGQIRGAGIDTFEGEPVVNPELLKRPQIVVTPHIASAGEATRDNMCRLALDNARAVLRGRAPLTPVTV